MHRSLLTASIAVLTFAHVAHADDVIAASSGGDDGFGSSTPSSINPSSGIPPFPLPIAADYFMTTTGGTVDTVTFWGRTPQLGAPLSALSRFRIRVFEDASGEPGAVVTDQSISVFQITTTADGPFSFYRYDISAATSSMTAFDLDPSTGYWLSVAAEKTFNNTASQWSWQFSPDRDGVQLWTQGLPDSDWFEVFGDESATAFSLEGTAAPPPCPGDVDGDGDTDLADFTALGSNFGLASGATREDGDLDGDGDVDLEDFSILGADFGCAS